MNVKDTEECYKNIIEQVAKEISNIDQINRTSEAIDFLKQVSFQFSAKTL